MTRRRFHLAALVGLLAACFPAGGQTPVLPGDLVVLRVADRTANTAQALALLEYNPATFLAPVQAINVASSGATAATISGSSGVGGVLSYNPNNTITFAAYRADAGAANPVGQPAAGVNRVIGSLDVGTGAVNTNVGLSGSYSGVSFRSVATADGQTFYLSGANGTNGGPQLATVAGGLPAAPTTVSSTTALTTTTNNNTRQIQVVGGNVYIASGGATPGQQVFQVGSGTPTTGNQTLTGTFGNQGTTNQYNSFALARLGTGAAFPNANAGIDTIYAVDNDNTNGSTVQKFTFNGTTWDAKGSVSLIGANNIAIRPNGLTGVDLFVTTSATAGSTVATLTDAGGFDGSLSGTFSTVLTATGNEGFYGIAFVPTPVPEPTAVLGVAAGVLGASGVVRRRVGRRVSVTRPTA